MLGCLARLGKRIWTSGLAVILFAGGAAAEPDWELLKLRADLDHLSAALRTDQSLRAQRVRDLVNDLDWAPTFATYRPTAESFEPVETARIGWTDVRFALASLGQFYGGKDNWDVLNAIREDSTGALFIEAGTATLDQIRKRLTHRHMGRDFDTQVDVLRTPIVIGPAATLRLGRDETLLLSRADGAFIINFGRLEVFDAEISATEEPNKRNADFAPFVVSIGSGSVHLSGATFRRLGFGNTEKFAGLSILAYPTMRPSQRSVIEYSRFEQLVTLAIIGSANVEIRENKLFDMRRIPLLISRSLNAFVDGNLFAGDSPTNAIRVTEGSDGARVVSNIILEGSRAGLLITSGSDRVEVRKNLIWHRNGGGVKLNEVACGLVEQNLIIDDKQKGVEVRASDDVHVHRNIIIGNRNAGVWVSAQKAGSVTFITENQLRENGSGLSTATGASIALNGNDLSRQLPRLLDGDITQHFRAIVDDLQGERPILLDASGARPTDQLTPAACAS